MGEAEVFTALLKERYGVEHLPIVSGVATDSREVEAGDLYLPIVGANVDGHTFAAVAAEAGAAMILASAQLPAMPPDLATAKVADTVAELGLLAKAWRTKFPTRLIAITGSNGKTTTKNFAAAMLRRNHNLLYSEQSYNSKVGLPMTLLQLSGDHDLALVEIGTNQPGEVAYLADIAQPSVALVTNVSASHLAALVDETGVAQEKSELYLALDENGISVINEADEYVAAMATRGRRFTYALDPTGNQAIHFEGHYHESQAGATLTIATLELEIALPQFGVTMARNSLAAAALAYIHDVTPVDIKDAVENFELPTGRGEVCKIGEVTIINDTYNANPASTFAGIAMLSTYPGDFRRIAVVADMLELGDHSASLHAQIGRDIAEHKIDRLLCYGPESKATYIAAMESGLMAQHYEDKSALAATLGEMLTPSDLIYFKGSRGMAMETVIAELFGADAC